MKKQIKEWLVFTRKERIGLAVLIIIVTVVFIVPPLLTQHKPVLTTKEKNATTNNNTQEENNSNDNSHTSFAENNNPVSLFYFDPNNISAADWKKLGLRDKTIHTIQNYLSKGGRFYKPADLKKIYGLKENEFERLLPYIRLSETAGNNYERKPYSSQQNNYSANNYTEEKKYPDNNTSNNTPALAYKKKAIVIDINTADTAEWVTLPGIGSKRAWNIVNFRNKLGGFYSISQVAETYNIPDSVFQQIKPMLLLSNTAIKKININTVTKDELKMHPYIKWNIANAIIEYRNQHGPFTSTEQLLNIILITAPIYQKIAPYLDIN